MLLDMREQSAAANYAWMTQAVVPRPIAWILTENDSGGYNLAPFSYFNALCSMPPLIGVSMSRKPAGAVKDTLHNIRARGCFTVHIASVAQLSVLNESSATLAYGESEMARLKLKTEPFAELVRLSDCPIALFCRLAQEIALDDEDNQKLILGRIDFLYASDAVMTQDNKGRQMISAEKAKPLARLSAGHYASLGEVMQVERPK